VVAGAAAVGEERRHGGRVLLLREDVLEGGLRAGLQPDPLERHVPPPAAQALGDGALGRGPVVGEHAQEVGLRAQAQPCDLVAVRAERAAGGLLGAVLLGRPDQPQGPPGERAVGVGGREQPRDVADQGRAQVQRRVVRGRGQAEVLGHDQPHAGADRTVVEVRGRGVSREALAQVGDRRVQQGGRLLGEQQLEAHPHLAAGHPAVGHRVDQGAIALHEGCETRHGMGHGGSSGRMVRWSDRLGEGARAEGAAPPYDTTPPHDTTHFRC
jgi:hypothetical protein